MPPEFELTEGDRRLAGAGPGGYYSQLDETAYNQLKADMVECFNTPHGRRVFWHLLLMGHYVNPVFSPKNPQLARLAVERDFVHLHLFMLLAEASPGLLADILTQGLYEQARTEEE